MKRQGIQANFPAKNSTISLNSVSFQLKLVEYNIKKYEQFSAHQYHEVAPEGCVEKYFLKGTMILMSKTVHIWYISLHLHCVSLSIRDDAIIEFSCPPIHDISSTGINSCWIIFPIPFQTSQWTNPAPCHSTKLFIKFFTLIEALLCQTTRT